MKTVVPKPLLTRVFVCENKHNMGSEIHKTRQQQGVTHESRLALVCCTILR